MKTAFQILLIYLFKIVPAIFNNESSKIIEIVYLRVDSIYISLKIGKTKKPHKVNQHLNVSYLNLPPNINYTIINTDTISLKNFIYRRDFYNESITLNTTTIQLKFYHLLIPSKQVKTNFGVSFSFDASNEYSIMYQLKNSGAINKMIYGFGLSLMILQVGRCI